MWSQALGRFQAFGAAIGHSCVPCRRPDWRRGLERGRVEQRPSTEKGDDAMPRVTAEALCTPGSSWNPRRSPTRQCCTPRSPEPMDHGRGSEANAPSSRLGGAGGPLHRAPHAMHSGSPTLVMARDGEHELFRRQIMPTTGTGPAGPRSATQAQAHTSVNRAEPCGATLGDKRRMPLMRP